jgi:hypothetical protein
MPDTWSTRERSCVEKPDGNFPPKRALPCRATRYGQRDPRYAASASAVGKSARASRRVAAALSSPTAPHACTPWARNRMSVRVRRARGLLVGALVVDYPAFAGVGDGAGDDKDLVVVLGFGEKRLCGLFASEDDDGLVQVRVHLGPPW